MESHQDNAEPLAQSLLSAPDDADDATADVDDYLHDSTRLRHHQYLLPAVITALIIFVGLTFGLFLQHDPSLPWPYDEISSVIGWTYFAAWSVSFYPQLYYNWTRKSVDGLSFDFIVFNLLGFTAYTAYTCAFYWNAQVRKAYELRYHSSNDVQINDVFFAIHAVFLTLLSLVQCWLYKGSQQHVSKICMILTTLFLAVIAFHGLLTFHFNSRPELSPDSLFSVLSFLYLLSWVKLAITLIKYIPQVVLNWQRRSTVGWSISNILLDFTGGSLSVGQSILDASVKSDWSKITGSPIKFCLGSYSMIFDIIFMVQHYVLYAEGMQPRETVRDFQEEYVQVQVQE
jgi:cystinosin